MTTRFRLCFTWLILKRASRVCCTSISGCFGDLIVDEIAPYLPTVDLHSLSRTTSSIKNTLSHLLAQRHSMFISLIYSKQYRIKQSRTTTVATAQRWFERNAIPMKHCVTKIQIAALTACNNSNFNSHKLQQHYSTRFELSHQDYYPVDVESIRWLTRQSSTLQFLSLDQTKENTLSPSIVFFNDTIKLLEALRCAIHDGQRTFGDRDLKEVPMFVQMKWMQNFETPPEIVHQWLAINRFLDDIHGIIPEDDYQANKEWIDKWFDVIHSFWGNLLKEVNKYIFFRKFRSIEQIPRFQHSVRWMMFFYMFRTTGDPQEVVTLKEIIISNSVFTNGIRAFIEAVEMVLDDIKPVVFPSVNLSNSDILNDEEMVRGISLILNVMNRDDPFQLRWSESFIDSCDHWRGVLLDLQDADIRSPGKEILTASILWDLEALIAYIEPILFDKQHLHHVLLSLRNRMRRHIVHFILKESWF